jgi:hypothetical protein
MADYKEQYNAFIETLQSIFMMDQTSLWSVKLAIPPRATWICSSGILKCVKSGHHSM